MGSGHPNVTGFLRIEHLAGHGPAPPRSNSYNWKLNVANLPYKEKGWAPQRAQPN